MLKRTNRSHVQIQGVGQSESEKQVGHPSGETTYKNLRQWPEVEATSASTRSRAAPGSFQCVRVGPLAAAALQDTGWNK